MYKHRLNSQCNFRTLRSSRMKPCIIFLNAFIKETCACINNYGKKKLNLKDNNLWAFGDGSDQYPLVEFSAILTTKNAYF